MRLYLSSLLGMATLLSIAAAPVPKIKKEPQSQIQRPMLDFTSVAKKGTPSVVSIKVKSLSQSNIWGEEEGDESDLFSDPLFQRFFGRSPRQKQPERSPQMSQASGFIVSEDGYILTNQHVVGKEGEVIVTLDDGREFNAKVVGQDPNTDIALIKIEAKDLPALTLGDSDALEVGQWVASIGNPLGLQATFTVGVVSAKGRNNLDIETIEDFIQTDAPVNRGNSGGPLLDMDGNVIGMTTAIVTSNGMGGYMGISFAIPSNMVKHVMDQIVATGSVTRGYLGLTMQAVDKDLAQAFGLSRAEGALVAEIVPDSPAAKAGLKQGDIIIKLNGNSVKNIAGLRNTIALMKPDSKVNLLVLRDGKEVTIPVQIGNFPISTPAADLPQSVEKFGFSVESLTPELSQKYNLGNDKGIVVSKVESGSAAAWAGLRQGALIMSINKQPINSIEDYNRVMSKLDKNSAVLFLVKQSGVVRFLSLKISG